MATVGSYGGGGSYERGTPVPGDGSSEFPASLENMSPVLHDSRGTLLIKKHLLLDPTVGLCLGPYDSMESSETPDSWKRFSGVTAAGSASFPQTITRGPATKRPFREIRALRGVRLPSQSPRRWRRPALRRAHLLPCAPTGPPALRRLPPLHCTAEALNSLPPHLDCS